jgi:AraC-like DNA-binding protein
MFVSVIIVRGILAELQRYGIEPAEALTGLDLREDQLSDLRARISFAELDRVIQRAISLSGDPGLGLSLGIHAPESMLQIIGHLMVSCRTPRDAFAVFERYSPLLADSVRYTLSEEGEQARFTYHCPVPLGDTSRFAAEYVLVMAQRIATHFVSDTQLRPRAEGPRTSSLRASAVLFEHARPAYAQRYDGVFECPIHFEQQVSGLVFPRSVLDATQLHADATVNTALRDMAERLYQEIDEPRSVSERIRELLRYESTLAVVDVGKLARGLGITPRSLRRRLAAEGASLTALLDEARCRLACEELRRNGSIKAIAERVGFSEPSAFHRAFKRWTGQTPLEYLRSS